MVGDELAMSSNGTATQIVTEDGENYYRIGEVSRLDDEGFTTEGARRHLKEQAGLDNGTGDGAGPAEDTPQILSRKMLLDLRDTLRAFLTLLEGR